ncbi:DUF2269 family protein [Roseibacterium sp. SDUM158016]|jgi:hypothetical protein|uniref:DUF2269 family protein n=1 Tax=Roseicyclus sediminis TaxID=2980997 RepID=UPI0021CFCACC|nr:DUF2269 family protein [Roseibacterium sp. SDUM158016]MCU4653262.1 DUF2269 family protein [Roseibacterium sp. SDUM158016]
MSLPDLAVLLHVIFVIMWLGGGLALLVGAEVMRRKRGPASVLVVVDIVALLGPGYFVPISILTLLTGLVAAWMGPGFGELWVALGIAGFAATFLTGILLIKPRAEKLAASTTGGQVPQGVLLGQADNLVTIARFDYVVLFLVVAVMVLKPAATDIAVLGAMAAAAAIGARLTIVKGLRGEAVA